MIRLGGAAAIALAPIAGIAGLLASGRQDYARCFDQITLSFGSALRTEAAGLLHPIALVGLVPFFGLAWIWYSRTNRRLTGLLWLAVFGLAVALLWPPSSQHDCDRKGVDGLFAVLVLAFPGLIVLWIALWKSKPLGSLP